MYNPKASRQSLYIERNIVDIDEALKTDTLAASFKDCEWAPATTLSRIADPEAEELLTGLKERCRSGEAELPKESVFIHNVPWVYDGKLAKENADYPEEWSEYLESLGSQVFLLRYNM